METIYSPAPSNEPASTANAMQPRFITKCLLQMIIGLLLLNCSALADETLFRQDLRDGAINSLHYAIWGDATESSLLLSDAIEQKTAVADFRENHHGQLTNIAIALRPSENEKTINYGIKRVQDGFVQVLLNPSGFPGRIVWYNDDLEEVRATTFPSIVDEDHKIESASIRDDMVLAFFDWIPVGDKIFAYGILGLDGDTNHVTKGFFSVELETLRGSQPLPTADLVQTFTEYGYYTLNHPYIAKLGSTAYYLTLEGFAELRYFDVHSKSEGLLEDFSSYSRNDQLPELVNQHIHLMYREIEQRSVPVGLYSNDEDSLYLLHRHPGENNSSKWTLARLVPDLENGTVRVTGRATLPTQNAARHLILVPGRNQWAMIELGSVREDRKRPPLSLVILPDQWFEKLDQDDRLNTD